MSTDTLEFPTIEEPRAAVATIEAGAVDLAKLDLQAVALAQFNTSHAAANTAREKLTGVVHDLSTPTKLADAKSLRHRLIGQPLAEARKVSAGLKSKLTAVSKAVGAELVAIESAFDAADALIKPQIEAREAELEAERQRKAEAEAARMQKHRDNLAKLAGYVEHARGLPSARIADGIAKVSGIEIDREAWEEFADQAEKQKADTLAAMQKLHADALADEERERAAAALKAEQERLAAERAEIERQRAELQAEKDRAAAEAKAKAEEAARVERVQREEAERQARELQEARARAERAEADAKARADAAHITTEQGSQQVLKAEPATADATDRDAPASTSPSVGSMGAGQPADAGPAAGIATPLHTTYTRTLRLGEIQARLAPLSITAEGLAQLGFPAHVERGLKLYWPGDFPAICRAISDHALALASAPQQLAA